MRNRKGRRASCTGTRKSPQYHVMTVNARIDAGKATGKANSPNVFLSEG